jgi:hypothetical protein
MSLKQLHDFELESNRKYYRVVAFLYFIIGTCVGSLLTHYFFNP